MELHHCAHVNLVYVVYARFLSANAAQLAGLDGAEPVPASPGTTAERVRRANCRAAILIITSGRPVGLATGPTPGTANLSGFITIAIRQAKLPSRANGTRRITLFPGIDLPVPTAGATVRRTGAAGLPEITGAIRTTRPTIFLAVAAVFASTTAVVSAAGARASDARLAEWARAVVRAGTAGLPKITEVVRTTGSAIFLAIAAVFARTTEVIPAPGAHPSDA